MRVCPYCAEELPDEATRCTHCGRDTSVEPEWASAPRPPDPAPGLAAGAAPPPAGEPVPIGAPGSMPREKGAANTLAVLSLVVVLIGGGLSMLNWWLSLSVVVVGVAMAGVAIRQIRSSPGQDPGFGFALVALVFGALDLLGFLRSVV